jgi:hypothetical protein
VIALNSLLYSTTLVPPLDPSVTDPCGQLNWLTGELAQAKANQEKVIIVGHIPPLAGSWMDAFIASYRATIAPHTSSISLQLFGHLHQFLPVAYTNAKSEPLLICGGGFTRKSKTVPSFGIFAVDASAGWAPRDYHQVYLSMDDAAGTSGIGTSGTWTVGPSFVDTYALPEFSASAVHALAESYLPAASPSSSSSSSSSSSASSSSSSSSSSTFGLGGGKDMAFDNMFAMINGGYRPEWIDKCGIKCARDWACYMISSSVAAYETCKADH